MYRDYRNICVFIIILMAVLISMIWTPLLILSIPLTPVYIIGLISMAHKENNMQKKTEHILNAVVTFVMYVFFIWFLIAFTAH